MVALLGESLIGGSTFRKLPGLLVACEEQRVPRCRCTRVFIGFEFNARLDGTHICLPLIIDYHWYDWR
jgi:hypothetical protein